MFLQLILSSFILMAFNAHARKPPVYCEKKSPDSDKVLFVFEGSNGYAPKSNKRYRESRLIGNFKDPTESNKTPHMLMLIMGLDRNDSFDFDWQYYGHRRLHQAIRCAKKLHKKGIEVFVLGYSLGGETALRFTHKLNKSGIKVRAGVSIDPVEADLFSEFLSIVFLRDKLVSSKPKDLPAVPKGVTWLNMYQDVDEGSLKLPIFGRVKIIGTNIDGAENVLEEWDMGFAEATGYQYYAHNDIALSTVYLIEKLALFYHLNSNY